MISNALRIEGVSLTDQGCVRAANEDSLLDRAADGLWAVADGMGGHANGQYASRRVIDELATLDLPGDISGGCDRVADAIYRANAEIFAEATTQGQQMGTTIVTLLVREDQFAVLWAGDSRAYLFRNGALLQLTTDHTQVQQMVDRGLLTAEDAVGHPMGHVLARAVGVEAEVVVDGITDALHAGDLFLLCSDGLSGVVADREIAGALHSAGLDAAAQLVALSLQRGAPDNVTVAVVAVSELTTLRFATADGA